MFPLILLIYNNAVALFPQKEQNTFFVTFLPGRGGATEYTIRLRPTLRRSAEKAAQGNSDRPQSLAVL